MTNSNMFNGIPYNELREHPLFKALSPVEQLMTLRMYPEYISLEIKREEERFPIQKGTGKGKGFFKSGHPEKDITIIAHNYKYNLLT